MNKIVQYIALAAGFFVVFVLLDYLINKSINWGTTILCAIIFTAIEIAFDTFFPKKK